MPRVALTEETGIILARHLKSCKRRTPPQTPFFQTTGPWQSYDFSVGGLCDAFVHPTKAKTVQKRTFFRFFCFLMQ
jgi:hypothetical protein